MARLGDVAPGAVNALRDAMEGYQSAVLEAAGHPVQDAMSLGWTGPCGHYWHQATYYGTDLVAPDDADEPALCPVCTVLEQRDAARGIAARLEAEVAALTAVARQVLDDNAHLCDQAPGECACSANRLQALLDNPLQEVPYVDQVHLHLTVPLSREVLATADPDALADSAADVAADVARRVVRERAELERTRRG